MTKNDFLAFGPHGQVWNFSEPNDLPGFDAHSEVGRRLANIHRFQGQKQGWTVAAHCLLAVHLYVLANSRDFKEAVTLEWVNDCLMILLHDADELVIPDIPAPLKVKLRQRGQMDILDKVGADFLRFVYKKLDLEAIHAECAPETNLVVKKYDAVSLAVEKAFIFDGLTSCRPWSFLEHTFGKGGPFATGDGRPPIRSYSWAAETAGGDYQDWFCLTRYKLPDGLTRFLNHVVYRGDAHHVQAQLFNDTLWRLRAMRNLLLDKPDETKRTEAETAFLKPFAVSP